MAIGFVQPCEGTMEYPTYEYTKARAKLKLKAIFELKEEF